MVSSAKLSDNSCCRARDEVTSDPSAPKETTPWQDGRPEPVAERN